MSAFEQIFLKPGDYNVGGEMQSYSARDLLAIAMNTQRLADEGYEIPVFLRHAAPGAPEGGPVAPGASRPDAVGRVTAVWMNEADELTHRLEIDDAETAGLVEQGRLRATSPEIRPRFLDEAGCERGPVIAHIALTNEPRNPDQSPLAGVHEAVQFSLDDLQDSAVAQAEDASEPILAQLAEPPGDVSEAPLPTDRPTTEPRPEPGRSFRESLAGRIRRSRRLPRGLKRRFAAAAEAVQFSDDGSESPSLRLSDAVEWVEQSLPAQVLLAADDADEADHPHGEAFFHDGAQGLTDDQATRIAAEQLAATGFAPRA